MLVGELHDGAWPPREEHAVGLDAVAEEDEAITFRDDREFLSNASRASACESLPKAAAPSPPDTVSA